MKYPSGCPPSPGVPHRLLPGQHPGMLFHNHAGPSRKRSHQGMKTQNVQKKLVQYVLFSAGTSDIEKSDDHLMIIWESHDTPWSKATVWDVRMANGWMFRPVCLNKPLHRQTLDQGTRPPPAGQKKQRTTRSVHCEVLGWHALTPINNSGYFICNHMI